MAGLDLTQDPEFRRKLVLEILAIVTAEINGDHKTAEDMFFAMITDRMNESQGSALDLIQLLSTQLEGAISIIRTLSSSFASSVEMPEGELWQQVATAIAGSKREPESEILDTDTDVQLDFGDD